MKMNTKVSACAAYRVIPSIWFDQVKTHGCVSRVPHAHSRKRIFSLERFAEFAVSVIKSENFPPNVSWTITSPSFDFHRTFH